MESFNETYGNNIATSETVHNISKDEFDFNFNLGLDETEKNYIQNINDDEMRAIRNRDSYKKLKIMTQKPFN